jgi:hypothetical protein
MQKIKTDKALRKNVSTLCILVAYRFLSKHHVSLQMLSGKIVYRFEWFRCEGESENHKK